MLNSSIALLSFFLVVIVYFVGEKKEEMKPQYDESHGIWFSAGLDLLSQSAILVHNLLLITNISEVSYMQSYKHKIDCEIESCIFKWIIEKT